MSDKALFSKISKGLIDICERQGIGRVNKFYLIIKDDCKISQEGLHKQLKVDLPNNVFQDTSIVIERQNIEIFSAIIYKVEGEKIKKI
ncbi:MAG: hypothetical protein AB7V16_00855 [Vulcanibacillus sp.]